MKKKLGPNSIKKEVREEIKKEMGMRPFKGSPH